ncbi:MULTISPECIES: universal stress protein [Alphaproteobacteria]
MRHILLATDGSESARRASEIAANLARTTGSRLFILTVEGSVLRI